MKILEVQHVVKTYGSHQNQKSYYYTSNLQ